MRQRSSYPKPFKAQVVQECLQPGETVPSVAISHGINANVICKWMLLYRDLPAAPSLPAFISLTAALKRPAESSVIIELPLASVGAYLTYARLAYAYTQASSGSYLRGVISGYECLPRGNGSECRSWG
ncbi:transposase [Pseudomonas syringae]|uniref:transposase n=1 Tax=Pseudomonas syringae TaxID=317 RepID=UPI0009AFCC8D|nr:transposase [Pseudomonas syringae]